MLKMKHEITLITKCWMLLLTETDFEKGIKEIIENYMLELQLDWTPGITA